VDVGFFQDMSAHHNQAVAMSLIYLEHGTDPLLRHVAREIVLYQSSEIGVMSEYLNTWGENGTEGNESMAWMGMPAPRDQMMGMASARDMRRLADARGPKLDALFTELMIRHHEGGVQMAEYAAEHAGTETVRSWAIGMADAQRAEIAELNRWRVNHDLPSVQVDL
jgi:uncharacterized protein (DUF305 family)